MEIEHVQCAEKISSNKISNEKYNMVQRGGKHHMKKRNKRRSKRSSLSKRIKRTWRRLRSKTKKRSRKPSAKAVLKPIGEAARVGLGWTAGGGVNRSGGG